MKKQRFKIRRDLLLLSAPLWVLFAFFTVCAATPLAARCSHAYAIWKTPRPPFHVASDDYVYDPPKTTQEARAIQQAEKRRAQQTLAKQARYDEQLRTYENSVYRRAKIWRVLTGRE